MRRHVCRHTSAQHVEQTFVGQLTDGIGMRDVTKYDLHHW